MKRNLYCAQYQMNPQSEGLQKLDVENSNVLPDPDWDTPTVQFEAGSVESGVAYTDAMYDHQPKYSTKKRP